MSGQKTVFLTGATGFVGGHIARLLVGRGDRVLALCRRQSNRRLVEDLDVEWVEGDLREPKSYEDALFGCSSVFHCAADYRLFSRVPRELYQVNVEGTRALFESCERAEVGRIVYTSSVAALEVPSAGRLSSEADRTRLEQVVGHYKRSKFLAQEVALEKARAGLPVVIVNPSTPVGHGDLKPTATGKIIVDFLNRKMPAYLDTGLNLVPVEDVAAGHLLAEAGGVAGELYILGGVNLSLREILEMLSQITGLRAPSIQIPYAAAWAAGLVSTFVEGRLLGRDPQVPLEGVRMARKKMYFDSHKAVRELGFASGSVYAALERAVDWFYRHGYATRCSQATRLRRLR